MYETFAHTADLGLRIRAGSIEELFRHAALGLFSMLVVNFDDVQPRDKFRVELPPDDLEFQLFDWLSELLFQFDSKHVLLCEFDVKFVDGRLKATCKGEPLDSSRHQMDREVKAITYHDLKIERQGDQWHAELIVDI